MINNKRKNKTYLDTTKLKKESLETQTGIKTKKKLKKNGKKQINLNKKDGHKRVRKKVQLNKEKTNDELKSMYCTMNKIDKFPDSLLNKLKLAIDYSNK